MENNNTKQQSFKKQKPVNFESSFNRLVWRFKNSNVKVNESKFVINDNDIESVDFLINWINNQKNETLKENAMFAKLVCYCLKHEINFYKGDVKMAVKKIEEQLKIPIQYHYSEIHETLNRHELINYMDEIGVVTKHPLLRTESENIANAKIFKENNPEITKKIFGTWSVDNVYKSLNNTITELINKYKKFD